MTPPPPPPHHRRTVSAPSISVEDTTAQEPLQEVRTDEPGHPPSSIPDPDPAYRHARRATWNYTGNHRRRSPGPEWRTPWKPDDWKEGRVVVIDFVGRDHAPHGKRQILTREIRDSNGLRALYSSKELREQSILRVIHVQNASWAVRFLLRKFNMEHEDDLVGTTFGKWAQFEKPQQRAGKPVLNGKTFRPQRDPWRGVSRCAFGLDYLKYYDARKYNKEPDDEKVKMMELNRYDAHEMPTYGYDVFVQRLSVYVQRDDGPPLKPQDLDFDMRNPYNKDEYEEYQRLKKQYQGDVDGTNDKYFPRLPELDNGNTIIVFEQAQSNSPEDTLIQGRNEIEERWRRLPFYLKKEQSETDTKVVVECMDLILKDIFKAIAVSWDKYLHACDTHVSILEDKVYDNPADESRAPELWANSLLWLRVEKLMYLHLDIVKELRLMMKELTEEDALPEWLTSIPEDFDKLANTIQEDLIKPTSNLSDMMYKSVEIRDSRQSLQLGTSMWRLSWITFIFLPLTFIVGFFGMNVDIFAHDPSIKWYFISAVPLMLLVFLFWLFFKRAFSTFGPGRDYSPTATQRGVYEHLYHDFSDHYPRLWARNGPRAGVEPQGGWVNKLKWRLVKFWFEPDKTIRARGYDAAEDLGTFARFKRQMARRWLQELSSSRVRLSAPADGADAYPLNGNSTDMDLEAGLMGPAPAARLGPVQELMYFSTQAAAEGEPTAAVPLRRLRSDSGSSARGSDKARPTSQGSGGVVVEEEASDVGGSGSDGDGERQGRRSGSTSREALKHVERVRSARRQTAGSVGMDRLSVPFVPGRAGELAP